MGCPSIGNCSTADTIIVLVSPAIAGSLSVQQTRGSFLRNLKNLALREYTPPTQGRPANMREGYPRGSVSRIGAARRKQGQSRLLARRSSRHRTYTYNCSWTRHERNGRDDSEKNEDGKSEKKYPGGPSGTCEYFDLKN